MMTFHLELFLLISAILMLVSVLSSKLSDKFAVPALLLFIIIGMIAGSEGIGKIQFDNYQAATSIGIIALIFIIFMGGFDTPWESIKSLLLPGTILATVGVFITALVVGLFSVVIFKFSLIEGLLLGAIVSSTDAAAVFSVLRSKKISLKGDLKPLLEFESGSNDPMAVFLTISMLSFLSGSKISIPNVIWHFFLNMGIGAICGYLMSKVTIYLIKKLKLDYEGLYPVLTISLVLLTYAIATLLKGNGFLAVYFLGLLISKSDFANKRMLIRFHEGIAWLMQILMFLTLGLLVYPSQVIPVVLRGLLIAGVLIFLARPISIFLCLFPFKFQFKEKLMISWVGLRGAVPVILATFPLLAGIPQSQTIFNIVFFVVLTSVVIQGISIPFFAKILNVHLPIDSRKKFPIELEHSEAIDASLEDIIVPYNSAAIGKAIYELNIPSKSLIVLISRQEKFFVPNGSTKIEGGDVLLVLANKTDFKSIQQKIAVLE